MPINESETGDTSPDTDPFANVSCPDCAVRPGQPHLDGCDVARCLETGEERLEHQFDAEDDDWDDEDTEQPGSEPGHDCGHDIWTGERPNEADCRRLGWYSIFRDGRYIPCDANEPGAQPDLNRLRTEALWDKAQQRFVAP